MRRSGTTENEKMPSSARLSMRRRSYLLRPAQTPLLPGERALLTALVDLVRPHQQGSEDPAEALRRLLGARPEVCL